ncbi:GNAT family N-acetyltransferase [Halovibrio salipaludis]|uniref:GNAT family N-acetyltransferase n=1 Tax=Halovibrio salipaludis TaxID=2032626 RepID=A0A2A2F8Q7_9GAMM|nr:GNAT family N-acetyltransferase [Halovibrio salipaludis]PAU81200.1 GNAT family N-acetyltransferase [Halovibrio salipaludis]
MVDDDSGHHLTVQRLDEAAFAALENEWTALVERASADPLFMGWPWLYSWWETWGQRLGLELVLYAAYEGERLVGIAPLFRHRYRSPVGITLNRLHFLGNAWRIQPTVRTEYCGIIAEEGQESTVIEAVLAELIQLSWHELIISDQRLQDMLRWQEAFDRLGEANSAVPRSVDSGVRVQVNGDFREWLANLGANTRLKAFNRRRYLEERGELSVFDMPTEDADAFLSKLNAFHQDRWGKPCFEDEALEFHRALLKRFPSSRTHLSVMAFNGEPISALYDICAGHTRYNLQLGFNEHFDRKVAPGTLHLGYAIEESFRNDAVDTFDMLAGRGKKSFYKSHFRGEQVHFLTVQFVRHPLMRWIYRIQSWLPGRLRQSINRFVRL